MTNKHVLDGFENATVYFHLHDRTGSVLKGKHEAWLIRSIDKIVKRHPDPDVDLLMFPIAGLAIDAEKQGKNIFFRNLKRENIPTSAEINTLLSIEEILMVGYPIGLMDEVNNMPILRRGITATSFLTDYNGKKEFVIDAACFPGSSGSPIFLLSNGLYTTSGGNPRLGERFFFLGVLWGGPLYTAEGSIVSQPVPTAMMPIALSSIPANLGFVLKSERVLEMASLLAGQFDVKD